MEALHEPSLDEKGSRKKNKVNGAHTVIRPNYEPYTVEVTIAGLAPILFHRYDPEQVKIQSEAKKGSKEKKTDNVDAYVYRNNKGELCMPGRNFKAALAESAKRFSDPSSPRRSARDLVRAGIIVNPFLSSFGRKDWDAIDVQGVVIQKNRVSRHRPIIMEGWKLTFEVEVHESEFIDPAFLRELVDRAGRFNGLGDFRPDYGRFKVIGWKVVNRVGA